MSKVIVILPADSLFLSSQYLSSYYFQSITVNCNCILSNTLTGLSNCIPMLTSVPGKLFHVDTIKKALASAKITSFLIVTWCAQRLDLDRRLSCCASRMRHAGRSFVSFSFCRSTICSKEDGNGRDTQRKGKYRIPTKTELHISYTIRVVVFFRIILFFFIFQHTCKTT